MTIPELIQKLKTINMVKIVDRALNDLRPEITDMQIFQLESGLDPGGDKFGDYAPYAWESYAELKHHMNPRPGFGNPDLKLTGSFYEGIKIKIRSRVIEIGSSDSKSSMLESQYKPFGLTPKNLDILIDMVYSIVDEHIKNVLKLAA